MGQAACSTAVLIFSITQAPRRICSQLWTLSFAGLRNAGQLTSAIYSRPAGEKLSNPHHNPKVKAYDLPLPPPS